jgi:two-component system nitrogen regulation response regulator GlnG
MAHDFSRIHASSETFLPDDGHPSQHDAGFGRILGTSEPMRELYSALERVGPTRDPVLIVGDRGTGKELVARTLHAMSSSPDAPFIVLPCAAIPDSLLEGELFGHEEERGADGAGCLELASGGTLFLDEIPSMPLSIQGKLLDHLKEGDLDLRLVAATTMEPEIAVVERKLHHDFFLFFGGITLRVPSLRERADDIPVLATEFARNVSLGEGRRVQSIEPEAMAALVRHDWPGNVRELSKVIERAVLREEGGSLRTQSLPLLGDARGHEFQPDESRRDPRHQQQNRLQQAQAMECPRSGEPRLRRRELFRFPSEG